MKIGKGADSANSNERISAEDLQKECDSAKRSLKRESGLNHILGKCRAVLELKDKIDRISSCDVNVLISGESGTGKELVARAIHYLSARSGKPFVPVNCGAIPETLFENELFGHIKGAFTDARFPQVGLVREADGGTLFLDEIGAVSPHIQVKFLRLLQDKEYKVLGDSRPRRADLRIIAATNRDLHALVKKGVFREDLFYRLNVVAINTPPLRERKEDIPALIRHFISQYSAQYGKPARDVSEDAMKKLVSYQWPGNVRELENKIQQCVVMSESSVISADCLQLPVHDLPFEEPELEHFSVAKKKVVADFERAYLTRLLRKYRGDMVRAAKGSGKSRTALWNLLAKHDLSPRRFRV